MSSPGRQPSPWDHPGSYFLLFLASALAAGWSESLFFGINYLRGQTALFFLNAHFVWMIPIAQVMLCLLPALIATGLAACRKDFWLRPMATLALVQWLFTLLGLLNSLGQIGIGNWALLILSAGLAWQLAGGLVAQPARAFRWVAGLAGGLSLLTLGTLSIDLALGAISEQQQEAALPRAAEGAPNVLLIVWDTARADHLSAYGHPRPTTPFLEKLAAEGVLWERAVAPSSWTLTTHGSLLTGYWPHEHKGNWTQPVTSPTRTLAEILQQHGYRTAGFVGNLPHAGRHTGLGRGMAHYEDFDLTWDQFLHVSRTGKIVLGSPLLQPLLGHNPFTVRKPGPEITKAFLNWRDQRKDRPYFAFLNYFDAHDPYFPGPPFDKEFGPQNAEETQLMVEWGGLGMPNARPTTPAEREAARRSYEGCLRTLDKQLSELIQALSERGDLDRTLIVLTSDHGEEFGERGALRHGYTLYRPSIDVPLVMRLPQRVPAGQRVPEIVSIRDVPRTILDVLALPEKDFPGHSLVETWGNIREATTSAVPPEDSGPGLPPGWILSELTNLDGRPVSRVLIGQGYAYGFLYENRHEELFDYLHDPTESRNLVQDPALLPLVNRFRQVQQSLPPP